MNGEEGVINLVKLVPVIGGVIGGGFDAASTKVIADNAYKMFINCSSLSEKDDIIDVDYEEIDLPDDSDV